MHKGKEKKQPPQLIWCVPDTWGFLFIAAQLMDGKKREGIVLSSLTDLNLISGIIVCVLLSQLCTAN